jgi:hypothetical protein
LWNSSGVVPKDIRNYHVEGYREHRPSYGMVSAIGSARISTIG